MIKKCQQKDISLQKKGKKTIDNLIFNVIVKK